MKELVRGLILIMVMAACIGAAAADTAVPVSPGGGTAITNQTCPTFSWSAAGNASSYRIEVYEQVTADVLSQDQMQVLSAPALSKVIAAPSLSWTPSSGECLNRGLNYVWYVQGVDALGKGQWSEGWRFYIEAAVLTAEQAEAVQQVVKGYLSGDGSNGSTRVGTPPAAATAAGDTITRSASAIVPMTLPAVIDAHGDTTNTFLGNTAGAATTNGACNTFMGANAGAATTSGSYNTFMGNDAGKLNVSGSTNTLVGWAAGHAITTENNNTMIGNYAGSRGSNNTIVGTNAGQMNQGNDNVFFGNGAGNSNSTGNSNTFIGSGAGYNNWGSLNVFIGNGAGYNDQTGSNKLYIANSSTSTPLIYGEFGPTPLLRFNGNVGVGKTPSTALDVSGTVTATSFSGSGSGLTGVVTAEVDPKVGTLTAGKWCTTNGSVVNCTMTLTTADSAFLGTSAGAAITTGTSNTFIGADAGKAVTSGSSNTFVGNLAGSFLSLGADNTFIGDEAGRESTSGSYNTIIGSNAGYYTASDRNTIVGYSAGQSNTSGGNNSFFGADSGGNNTTGWSNNFFGEKAGSANATGQENTFIGLEAGRSNIDGWENTFIGNNAGHESTGNMNTSVGYAAGHNNTGSGNVFRGYEAGYLETGSNKLYIDNCFDGSCTKPLIKGDFQARTLQIDGSLTMVTVATPSDLRYKKEIQPIAASLQKVLLLQGVTYEWDKERVNGAGYKSGKQIGLIAQEVEKVLPEVVHTDDKGYKTLSYDKVVPVLIEAVKEQHALHANEMKEKDNRIAKLEKALEDQQQITAVLALRLGNLEAQSQTAAKVR